MSDEQRGVPAPPGQSTPPSTPAPIIPQDSSESVTETKKVRSGRRAWGSKRERHILHLESKVRSVALKFYCEQMPRGWGYVQNAIRGMDPKVCQVVGIRHYKDIYSDGSFWKTAFEKDHYHVILRYINGKSYRVANILNELGIYFRPGIDDKLWNHHAAESVDNFAGYVTYLTHETPDAIADGKEIYARDELVSNLTAAELDEVREGYVRLSDGKRKVSADELVALDEQAYALGYALADFDEWYGRLPLSVRSNAKMRVIRESYGRGVEQRVSEKSEVLRLCVYIQGEADSGKTFAAKYALRDTRVHVIEGGGSGKFDALTASHDAIIVSDDICPNLLNICDNYVCHVYRRQSNNPAWTGKFFIVTSNVSFNEWLHECGIKRPEHITAMYSRFFICDIRRDVCGGKRLALLSPSTRGKKEERQARAEMFMEFQTKYNASLSAYSPEQEDYSCGWLIDPDHRTVEDELCARRHVLEQNGFILKDDSDDYELNLCALEVFGRWFWGYSSQGCF